MGPLLTKSGESENIKFSEGPFHNLSYIIFTNVKKQEKLLKKSQ
jgi:hypothetical protein